MPIIDSHVDHPRLLLLPLEPCSRESHRNSQQCVPQPEVCSSPPASWAQHNSTHEKLSRAEWLSIELPPPPNSTLRSWTIGSMLSHSLLHQHRNASASTKQQRRWHRWRILNQFRKDVSAPLYNPSSSFQLHAKHSFLSIDEKTGKNRR